MIFLLSYDCGLIYLVHTNYYYPVSSRTEGDTRWDEIVCFNLNKCWECRRMIKEVQLQKKGDEAIESDITHAENWNYYFILAINITLIMPCYNYSAMSCYYSRYKNCKLLLESKPHLSSQYLWSISVRYACVSWSSTWTPLLCQTLMQASAGSHWWLKARGESMDQTALSNTRLGRHRSVTQRLCSRHTFCLV